MEFTFNSEFNERLYETRHIGFESALEAITAGKVLANYANANPGDSAAGVLLVTLGDSTYYLPYRVVGKKWLLQTLYPVAQFNPQSENAGATGLLPDVLNEEERNIVSGARRWRPTRLEKPDSTTVAKISKAAAKLLKRQRKGKIRISADGPPGTKEHFGEIAGRVGKTGRW